MLKECPKCFRDKDTTIMSIIEGELCTECLSKMQSAKSEPKRICLEDGTEMHKDLVHDVIIDKCPKCGGVWLDGGEIDTIRENLQNFQKIKNWMESITRAISIAPF